MNSALIFRKVPKYHCVLRRLLVHQNSAGGTLYASEATIERILSTGDLSAPPDNFNFARDIIDRWAKKKHPFRADNVSALWAAQQDGVSRQFSYQELSQISKQIAFVFNNLGLKKGDRIILCVPKCAEYWLTTLAALRCGLEISTVITQATDRDIKHRIDNFKPKAIISDKIEDVNNACNEFVVQHKISLTRDATGWQKLDSLMKSAGEFDGNPTSIDDPCIVFFTSGTTGKPKMVEHTHVYTLAHLLSGKYYYCLEKDDLFWCMADTGWAKVAWGTFPTWLYGAGLFVETSTRFSVEGTLKTLRNYPVTKLCAPPTVYRQLITDKKANFNFKSLNDCVSAGEPLNPEAYHEWKSLTGLGIREGYGQTETILIACTPKGKLVKPGSMGFPIKENRVQILDDNGKPVEKGQTGQIAVGISPVKPLGLLKGYRGDPKKNESAFKDGFYLTGDKAYEDDDGYLWFVSRTDDVITSSGYRIGPFEIESVLLEHEAVVESAVVGVPDPKRLEAVKAFIVLNDNFLEHDKEELIKEIQEFVKKRTAPYKYPRIIEFVTSLPKTMSGKIQRNLLRQK